MGFGGLVGGVLGVGSGVRFGGVLLGFGVFCWVLGVCWWFGGVFRWVSVVGLGFTGGFRGFFLVVSARF